MRALIALTVSLPGLALAYSSPTQFDLAPSADSTGGAAGIYYSGSPRFQGQSCSGCHQGGEDAVDLRFTALPSALIGAPYVPRQVYHLQIDLLTNRVGPLVDGRGCGAHPGEVCDVSGFVVEAVGADGRAAGMLCPMPPVDGACPTALGTPTVAARDGTALFSNPLAFDDEGLPTYRDGQSRFDFYWQAPAADVGAVSFWIAAVDGDGATQDTTHATDTAGDRTGVFRLQTCAPTGCESAAEAGCAAAPGRGAGGGWALGLWAVAMIAERRRRR